MILTPAQLKGLAGIDRHDTVVRHVGFPTPDLRWCFPFPMKAVHPMVKTFFAKAEVLQGRSPAEFEYALVRHPADDAKLAKAEWLPLTELVKT